MNLLELDYSRWLGAGGSALLMSCPQTEPTCWFTHDWTPPRSKQGLGKAVGEGGDTGTELALDYCGKPLRIVFPPK